MQKLAEMIPALAEAEKNSNNVMESSF